jgi:mannosyltransferase OCH1-like enzyme
MAMIPKIIHYCWLSGDPYSKEIIDCMGSWKKHLPDYEFKKWDTKTFDINSIQWVKEAYEAKKYAFASDYIRFYVLYNYGGIYLDTDVEVIKPFDSLLLCNSFMGFEYISIPESAVIGSVPGIPWVKKCLDYYSNKSFFDTNGKQRTVAVPIMMKAILKEHYNQPIFDNSMIQDFGDLILYPYQFFSSRNPYKKQINVSSKTYCIHYSLASWCGGGHNKIKRYIHLMFTVILGKHRYDELLYRYHLKKI